MKRPPKRPTVDAGEPASARNSRLISARWSGPLPPPAQLEEFERIVPGGAERVFAQFEAEGDHRRAMEAQNVKFVIRDRHIGQVLAVIYALGAFGLTAFAISHGAN